MKESGAAAISTLINGAANATQYFEKVRSGSLPPKAACLKIIAETVTSAADSALKAAGSAGNRILEEKYGSRENALKAFANQGIAALMEKTPFLNNTSAKNIISQLVGMPLASSGENHPESTSEGTGASSVIDIPVIKMGGNAALNLIKSKLPNFSLKFPLSLGKLPLPKCVPPHPAAIAVAISVAIASKIAIQNHIERPFQDLIRNTDTLNEAARELERVSASMLKGQKLFGEFLESDAQMERELKNQFTRIDKTGNDALDAILKI